MVTSRGPHRHVDELRYRDSENFLEEADHECMHDTDQEQPTLVWDVSEDHIPILERKWKDIMANEFSHRYVGNLRFLVRHENYRDRETDGAIH